MFRLILVTIFHLFVFSACSGSILKPRDPVGGIISCGSQGSIVQQVRVTDCTAQPCTLFLGALYNVEVDFIPFASHTNVRLRVTFTKDGVDYTYLNQTLDLDISAGSKFTARYPVLVPDALGAGLAELRMELSGDGVSEMCAIISSLLTE